MRSNHFLELVPLEPGESDMLQRRYFCTFLEACFRELHPQLAFFASPCLDLLSSRLQACAEGRCRRLIINLPPRSLKSVTASVALPAWLLGRDPSKQIICASYGQELADKHARDCRSVMGSAFYRRLFPASRISARKTAVNDFSMEKLGFRMSTSVGGVLTGRGADIIIIDDPLKPDDALSESRRTAVNDWYDNSLLSRLNRKAEGVIIIVMQRLHQDDLVGHVIASGEWEVLSLPAIAEENESYPYDTPFETKMFRRSIGEVLEPDRDSKAILDNIRKTIGEYNFVSQYQQNPMPMGGAIIKADWLQYYEPQANTSFDFKLQSWDTANKSGELSNFSVCTTWGVLDEKKFLLDVTRQRVDYPELKKLVRQKAEQFRPDHIIIENKASGIQLIQELKHDGLFRVKPYDPPPGADKIMRLVAQSAEFESGKVLLPASAAWLEEYRKELLTFPGSKHNDQVDSTSQALHYLKEKRSLAVWAKLGRASFVPLTPYQGGFHL